MLFRDSDHGSNENDVLVINELVATNEESSVTTETAPYISIPELESCQSETKIHVQIPSIEKQGSRNFMLSKFSYHNPHSLTHL